MKTYQIHTRSRTCRKYKNKNCRFTFDRLFSASTILAKTLPQSLDLPEKNQIVAWREGISTKV